MKYKYRLLPVPVRLAYVLQSSYLNDEEYHPGFPTPSWSSWNTMKVAEYKSEDRYFGSEADAKRFLDEYKKWLEKEPMDLEG